MRESFEEEYEKTFQNYVKKAQQATVELKMSSIQVMARDEQKTSNKRRIQRKNPEAF